MTETPIPSGARHRAVDGLRAFETSAAMRGRIETRGQP